jgi:hypothetical protein
MATVQKTYIRVPSQAIDSWIPGDYSVAQMQTMYAQQITGLSSMTGTATEEAGPNGLERFVTFTPRTGQKG